MKTKQQLEDDAKLSSICCTTHWYDSRAEEQACAWEFVILRCGDHKPRSCAALVITEEHLIRNAILDRPGGESADFAPRKLPCLDIGGWTRNHQAEDQPFQFENRSGVEGFYEFGMRYSSSDLRDVAICIATGSGVSVQECVSG